MNFNLPCIIGGQPSSGSSLLFYKLSKFYENSYFETGIFCDPNIYEDCDIKIPPFDIDTKKKNEKINLEKIFLEKTPENIFFFHNIVKKIKCNFIITRRNVRDLLNSLINRGISVDFESLIIGSTNIEINSIKKNSNVTIMDYEDICNLNISKKYPNHLKIYDTNLLKFKNIKMNSWNYKISDKVIKDSYLKTSNPNIDILCKKYLIKKNDLIFNIDGIEEKNFIENKKKNLKKNNLTNFLESRGYCLIEKNYL